MKNKICNFLTEHTKWIFSGIGASIIILIINSTCSNGAEDKSHTVINIPGNHSGIITGKNEGTINYEDNRTDTIKNEKIKQLTELNKEISGIISNLNAEDYEIIYGDRKNIEEGLKLYLRLAKSIVKTFHKQSVLYESNSYLFSKANKAKLDSLRKKANDDLAELSKEYARGRSRGEETIGRQGGLILYRLVNSSGTFLKEFSATTKEELASLVAN